MRTSRAGCAAFPLACRGLRPQPKRKARAGHTRKQSQPCLSLSKGVVLLALLASTATAGMWRWQRKLEFAKALCTRQYYDIGDLVIARLEADKSVIGIEKAFLHREFGEYYSDLAEMVVTEKKDLQLFIAYLDKARTYFRRFLTHPSIKTNPRYASDRFDIGMRLSRIQLAVADGHAREFESDRTSKADKETHKKQAVDIFKAGIDEFQRAVHEKAKEVAKVKGLTPPANADAALRDKWRKRYRSVREEYFRVRVELDISRVRFAQLLKRVKGPPSEWQAQLNAAEKDYRQLLLDFSGTPGAIQANLELARCLMEKGAKFDKEAIERLTEVWEKRIGFRHYKKLPCEAAQMKATILLRQKKGKDAVPVLDELLAFASDKVWNPDQKTVNAVIETLEAVSESDRENFDQRAVAKSFLMEAEAYAQMGAAAESAKKPRKTIRAIYGAAYDIALGVLEVRKFLDPRYSPLIEEWRTKANRPVAPAIVRQRYLDAINRKKYVEAAVLMREIASRQTLLPRDKLAPEQKRAQWFTVGQCYHAAGRHHEAAIAFLAAGRWFPEPTSEAYKAASAAISAANAAFQKSKAPHDEKFLRWIQMQGEALNPYGKGGIYIKQAETARSDGKLARALDILKNVDPSQDAYPHALYHTGLTYKAMYNRLDPKAKAGPDGRRAAASMRAAFDKLFAYYKTKAPELKKKGEDDAVERLTAVVGAAMAMYTDFYIRPPAKDPARVLELTTGLTRRFPGIETTAGYPVMVYSRMRAAYTQIVHADPDTGAKLLPIVDETWKALGKFPEFRYLDKAAAMAAQSHIALAKSIEKAAGAVKDDKAKAALTARATGHRDKAIEYYLQLVAIAPRQSLRTYRYILHSLKTRDHTPKSEDYRHITELAPKIIEIFRKDPRAAEDLLSVKVSLGIAYYHLQKYREAIPLLEDVDDTYEKRYQDDFKPYRIARRKWQEDPGNNPKPGLPPRRAAAQPDAMEKLAFCYLAADSKGKYERAERTYVTLTRLYSRNPDKYWVVFYNLCETYRRLEKHEEAVKQIDRAYLRDPTLGDRSSKARLRALVARIQKNVAKLEDVKRKSAIEPLIKRLLDNLRK